ncbi:MAG: hypothetical protein PUI41_03410, partial [Lachnospiraceae bacterium]|nr:hypothetical protein [Lachnospiraceae bacterium]
AVPQFYYTRSAFHRRVAAFLARFTAFLVACWRFPSGDSLLSGARNNQLGSPFLCIVAVSFLDFRFFVDFPFRCISFIDSGCILEI